MTVVIVGAAGGVGAAVAARFEAQGREVVAVDVRRPSIGQAPFIHCDLGDEKSIQRAANEVSTSFPVVDLLVQAAGIFADDHTARADPAVQSRMWRVNSLGPLRLTELLHDCLRRSKAPSVVFVASTDAIVASGGQDNEIGVAHDLYYASSKGAVVTGTRALAMRWASDGIRVNAVAPTIIRSPMTESLLAIPGKEGKLAAFIPLGRICEPADIADAVEALFALKMTTGHILPVDGGYLCQ